MNSDIKFPPKTLIKVHELLASTWLKTNTISLEKIRIDSTVVESNIATPSNSQLLNDRTLLPFTCENHRSDRASRDSKKASTLQ